VFRQGAGEDVSHFSACSRFVVIREVTRIYYPVCYGISRALSAARKAGVFNYGIAKEANSFAASILSFITDNRSLSKIDMPFATYDSSE